MKKITSIALLALAGLTTINAQASLSLPTDRGLTKFGFGKNNLISYDNAGETSYSTGYIGGEYNYAAWNNKTLYVGAGFRTSSNTYDNPFDFYGLYTMLNIGLNFSNFYTGIRIPFPLHESLYLSLAGGVQFADVTTNLYVAFTKFSASDLKTSLYAHASIGYLITKTWFVEGTVFFYPSEVLFHKEKVMKQESIRGGSSSLIVSFGYTF